MAHQLSMKVLIKMRDLRLLKNTKRLERKMPWTKVDFMTLREVKEKLLGKRSSEKLGSTISFTENKCI